MSDDYMVHEGSWWWEGHEAGFDIIFLHFKESARDDYGANLDVTTLLHSHLEKDGKAYQRYVCTNCLIKE